MIYNMNWTRNLFLSGAVVIASCIALYFSGGTPALAKIPTGLTVTCIQVPGKSDECQTLPIDYKNAPAVGLGDSLRITLTGSESIGGNGFSYDSLILFLDDFPVKDLEPVVEITGMTSAPTIYLTYHLKRDRSKNESKEVWQSLLGSPKTFMKAISVGVGLTSGEKVVSKDNAKHGVGLELLNPTFFTLATIVFAIILLLFLWLCRTSSVIRDVRGPGLQTGQMSPYSLGQTQMAWWFFLVLGSYLFITVATLDYETMSEQALILIGIAAGTGVGAIAIDSGKSATLQTELAGAKLELEKLAGKSKMLQAEFEALEDTTPRSTEQSVRLVALSGEKESAALEQKRLASRIVDLEVKIAGPVSTGILHDLMSDRSGVSFHRFQNVAWSFVLGMVFIFQVYQNLAMPDFSATLLALMGITSGTYLGFKFPEETKK